MSMEGLADKIAGQVSATLLAQSALATEHAIDPVREQVAALKAVDGSQQVAIDTLVRKVDAVELQASEASALVRSIKHLLTWAMGIVGGAVASLVAGYMLSRIVSGG